MRQQLSIENKYAKKSLGQNFITDKNFLEKISEFVPSDKNTNIIEIGPGKGALTYYLAKKKFKSLLLIEKDKELIEKLKKKFDDKTIKIINEDALKIDFEKLNLNSDVIIVGNLPFNISTQLLFKWLEVCKWPPFYKRMVLMFQKEVADRILSPNGNKNYGRISVAAQARCKIRKILSAPSDMFRPVPKVDGAILDFEPHTDYLELDFTILQKILKEAFSQRRKKIKKNLSKYINLIKDLNIDENLRAENLSVKDYCNISLALNKRSSLLN